MNDEIILSEAEALDTEEKVDCMPIEDVAEAKEEIADEIKSDEVNETEIKPDANEIAYLKAELDSLKKELDESRAFYGRLEAECYEFSELYPSVPLSTLPDSIWQSVKNGVPLAAAYALEESRTALASMRAEAINGENRNMSSGSLKNDSRRDYFTPEQVRAMSAAEVRANYTKIINSMSKWH